MADYGEQRSYGWVVARARELLSDMDSGRYRWRDEELLRWVSQGIEALASVRPASRYLGTRLVRRAYPEIPNVADASDETAYGNAIRAFAAEPLLVDPRWHNALVEYCCYKAFTMDQADAGNLALAQKHYRQFIEEAQK